MRLSTPFLALVFNAYLAVVVSAQAPAVPIQPVPVNPTPDNSQSLGPNFENEFEIAPEPRLSGRIIFTASVNGINRILVLDLDARRVRRVIEGPGDNLYPTWSPDGSRFVFVSSRDGQREIYISDWNGSNQIRLTNSPGNKDNPDWSANGKQIIFNADSPGSKSSNIWSINPDGTGLTQLTNLKERNTTPRISPDSSQIAYSTSRFWPGWDVCVWNIAVGRDSCPLQGVKSFCRPAWSPDGKQLGISVGIGDELDIGLLNLKDRKRSLLTVMPGREYDAAWSPKGDLIAFVAEPDVKDVFNIHLVNLDKKVWPLLKSVHSMRYLSWSPVKTLELEARRIRNLEQQGDAGTTTPAPVATNQSSSESPSRALPPVEEALAH